MKRNILLFGAITIVLVLAAYCIYAFSGHSTSAPNETDTQKEEMSLLDIFEQTTTTEQYISPVTSELPPILVMKGLSDTSTWKLVSVSGAGEMRMPSQFEEYVKNEAMDTSGWREANPDKKSPNPKLKFKANEYFSFDDQENFQLTARKNNDLGETLVNTPPECVDCVLRGESGVEIKTVGFGNSNYKMYIYKDRNVYEYQFSFSTRFDSWLFKHIQSLSPEDRREFFRKNAPSYTSTEEFPNDRVIDQYVHGEVPLCARSEAPVNCSDIEKEDESNFSASKGILEGSVSSYYMSAFLSSDILKAFINLSESLY